MDVCVAQNNAFDKFAIEMASSEIAVRYRSSVVDDHLPTRSFWLPVNLDLPISAESQEHVVSP